jgi:hypothetical protein
MREFRCAAPGCRLLSNPRSLSLHFSAAARHSVAEPELLAANKSYRAWAARKKVQGEQPPRQRVATTAPEDGVASWQEKVLVTIYTGDYDASGDVRRADGPPLATASEGVYNASAQMIKVAPIPGAAADCGAVLQYSSPPTPAGQRLHLHVVVNLSAQLTKRSRELTNGTAESIVTAATATATAVTAYPAARAAAVATPMWAPAAPPPPVSAKRPAESSGAGERHVLPRVDASMPSQSGARSVPPAPPEHGARSALDSAPDPGMAAYMQRQHLGLATMRTLLEGGACEPTPDFCDMTVMTGMRLLLLMAKRVGQAEALSSGQAPRM